MSSSTRQISAVILCLAALAQARAQFAPPPAQYPGGGYSVYPPSSQSPQPAPTGWTDDTIDQQHGAARLSFINGGVGLRRGDTSEVLAAVINAPVVAHDRVQTSPDGSAELELDSSNVVRLAVNTDLGLADAEHGRFRLQCGAGSIIYRRLRPSETDVEIDTPSVGLRPVGPSEIRVSVQGDGTTRISLRSGSAEMYGPRGSQNLSAGTDVLVRGDPFDPEFQQFPPLPQDEFDGWSAFRDGRLLSSRSYDYLSPDVSGGEDLDANGTWVPSQYGQVWSPGYGSADWSPYSTGQWNWDNYYGWTWVGAEPWGWAPYHYGRWFLNGSRGWCWWPGPRLGLQLWSPAVVGFFGLGTGSLGWVPLAPYEGFHTWWGRGFWRGGSPAYSGTAGIASFRNAAYRGGALVASYSNFSGPHGRFTFASREQLGAARVFQGRLPVTPNRSSYQYATRSFDLNPSLASAANRPFFTRQQTSNGRAWSTPASPASNSWGRIGESGRSYGGTYGPAPNSGNSGYRSSGTGWQRFGDPGAPGSLRQGFTGNTSGPGRQSESGWHQFGRPSGGTPERSRIPNQGTQGGGYSGLPVPRPQGFGSSSPYRGGGGVTPSTRAESPHSGAGGNNRSYSGGHRSK